MTPQEFREAVKEWRKSIKPAYRGRTKDPTRGKVALYPSTIERSYRRMLVRLFHAYIDPIKATINQNLDQWLAEARANMNLDAGESVDDMANQMESLDTAVFYSFVDPKTYGGLYAGVEATVAAYGWDTSVYTGKQWRKLLSVALPEAYPISETWVSSAVDQWAKINATYIDKAAGEWYANSEAIIRKAVFEGRRAEDVRRDLQKLDVGLTRNKAQLIARDQIGTLTGQLTKQRNENAGISDYIWQTAQDERVRGRPRGKWEYTSTSHWVMQGKLCRWDNPTVYSTDGGYTWQSRDSLQQVVTYHAKTSTGSRGKPGKASGAGKSKVAKAPMAHPGQEINCRCGSRPSLDRMIRELDAELANEGNFG